MNKVTELNTKDWIRIEMNGDVPVLTSSTMSLERIDEVLDKAAQVFSDSLLVNEV